MLITSDDEEQIIKLQEVLQQDFEMMDLGTAKNYLRAEIEYHQTRLWIHQKTYINRLLDRFKMTNCNISSLPMDPVVILTRETGTPATDPHEYRVLVGSLIYLTNTRPKVCFAVSNVSRYMDKPQVAHLHAAKLILKYLKGTINFGLHFPLQEQGKLYSYADVD